VDKGTLGIYTVATHKRTIRQGLVYPIGAAWRTKGKADLRQILGGCDRSHMNHSTVGITMLPRVINFSLLVSLHGTYRYGSASIRCCLPIFSSYGIAVLYTIYIALLSVVDRGSLQFNSIHFDNFVVPVYLPMRHKATRLILLFTLPIFLKQRVRLKPPKKCPTSLCSANACRQILKIIVQYGE
jgi:hypothetical protein